MHQKLITVGAAALLLATTGCSAFRWHGADEMPVVTPTHAEQQVIDATNAVRKAQGLTPLIVDPRLMAVARARSRDMAAHAYFGHVGPDGQDLFEAMHEGHVMYGAAGENLARNRMPADLAAQKAMASWENAADRANLLHPGYVHFGVGHALASNGERYFTEVFTD